MISAVVRARKFHLTRGLAEAPPTELTWNFVLVQSSKGVFFLLTADFQSWLSKNRLKCAAFFFSQYLKIRSQFIGPEVIEFKNNSFMSSKTGETHKRASWWLSARVSSRVHPFVNPPQHARTHARTCVLSWAPQRRVMRCVNAETG